MLIVCNPRHIKPFSANDLISPIPEVISPIPESMDVSYIYGPSRIKGSLLYVRRKTNFPEILWCVGWNVAELVFDQKPTSFLFLLLEYLHNVFYISYM